MSKIIKKSSKNLLLLICGCLPFLLSTYECKPTPENDSQNLVTKHNLDQKSGPDLEIPSIKTGFEDLDYWELEFELAQEMVRLNKQKKFLEDQNELRQKLKKESEKSSKSDISDKSTWQATEGVVDALIRSNMDSNKSKTVKRAASKSVEQRMLSAKYNRRGGMQSGGGDSSLKPRWMRLVYEMKNRKHHRSNNGKFRNTRKLL